MSANKLPLAGWTVDNANPAHVDTHGGTITGTMQMCEILFVIPSNGTYTASVTLPVGARLSSIFYDNLLTFVSGFMDLSIGDSDGPQSIMDGVGQNNVGADSLYRGVIHEANVDIDGAVGQKIGTKEKVYPTGDIITVSLVAYNDGAANAAEDSGARLVFHWYVPNQITATSS